jgi:hypothetical protein
MQMVSYDRKVADPTKRLKGKEAIKVPKGDHPKVMSMKTLTSLKWEGMTCLSKRTLD